jgi:Collagen triple helix repeat (20 copies)
LKYGGDADRMSVAGAALGLDRATRARHGRLVGRASAAALAAVTATSAIALAVPALASASARTSATAVVIHACYSKKSGELRIAPRKGCGKGQVALQWRSEGEAGAPGSQGTQGAVGPQGSGGAAGPTGNAGAAGNPGPAGASGPTGATGATGVTGATGASGATGAAGPKGLTGPTGAAGAQGAAGGTGGTGPTGNTGEPGPTGPTGPTGPAGLTGATGPAGGSGFPFKESGAEGSLPSGESESGLWSVVAAKNPIAHGVQGAAISFGIALASAPTNVEYLGMSAAPTTNCPGSAASPSATAGSLCVYATTEDNEETASFLAIENLKGTHGAASRLGAFVVFEAAGELEPEQGKLRDFGTWAVKAP